jgi:hypothetical protein
MLWQAVHRHGPIGQVVEACMATTTPSSLPSPPFASFSLCCARWGGEGWHQAPPELHCHRAHAPRHPSLPNSDQSSAQSSSTSSSSPVSRLSLGGAAFLLSAATVTSPEYLHASAHYGPPSPKHLAFLSPLCSSPRVLWWRYYPHRKPSWLETAGAPRVAPPHPPS